jgi:hypothetical protein
VVCPGPREADKCRQVIKMGHPGWDLYPIVIDPAHAPAGDGAGRYLPRFEFLLDGLPGVGEQQLRDRPLTAPAQITLLLLKIAADNPRLAADLAPWAGQLRSIAGQPGGTETLVALLTYIERVSEVPVSELHDLAASLGPEAKEGYVTTAEMLQAEGAARGAAETKAQDVLKVIDVRNLGPTREQRAMVTGDAGLDKLNRWFDPGTDRRDRRGRLQRRRRLTRPTAGPDRPRPRAKDAGVSIVTTAFSGPRRRNAPDRSDAPACHRSRTSRSL